VFSLRICLSPVTTSKKIGANNLLEPPPVDGFFSHLQEVGYERRIEEKTE
jgi:hypothetical protein